MNIRNRLIVELMARGGMRIGEVLNLRPCDIRERNLTIQNPKSGRPGEVVYVSRKLLVRLNDYTKDNNIDSDNRIFPISYVAAWSMVKKAGKLVNIELRHADLSTTQRYLGKVNDTEAIRWIETLYFLYAARVPYLAIYT